MLYPDFYFLRSCPGRPGKSRLDQTFQRLPVFPFFKLTFSSHGIIFIIKCFLVNQNPRFSHIWKAFRISIMFKKLILNIGRKSNVIFINFLRVNNIDRVHNQKPRKKRGLILSGGWGIRTPDPLLVRQMLWTSWAKPPQTRVQI